MFSQKDHDMLAQAAQLLADVIARHRDADLRAITILNAAVQDIRVGERYLRAAGPTETRRQVPGAA